MKDVNFSINEHIYTSRTIFSSVSVTFLMFATIELGEGKKKKTLGEGSERERKKKERERESEIERKKGKRTGSRSARR